MMMKEKSRTAVVLVGFLLGACAESTGVVSPADLGAADQGGGAADQGFATVDTLAPEWHGTGLDPDNWEATPPDQAPDTKPAAPDLATVCSKTNTCTVDLTTNTANCTGSITQVSLGGGKGVFKADISGCTRLEVALYICNPTAWSLNIGDSPSNNGYSGDGADFSNDAELQINGTTLSAYCNDYGSGQEQCPTLLTDSTFVPSTGCVNTLFTISDAKFETDSPAHTVTSIYTFRVNQPDLEGAPDAIFYVGLNRSISDSSRSGSGIQTATLTIK